MTPPNETGGYESRKFPEHDWKHLRVVHAAALERYCARVIHECRTVLDERDQTAHERYLQLFRLLRARDHDLAAAFNDMRRSRAMHVLAMLIRLDLATNEDLAQFSVPVRESAESLAKIYSSE